MTKRTLKNDNGDVLDLDAKLQHIMDQARSETEALKKILKALDEKKTMGQNEKNKNEKNEKK